METLSQDSRCPGQCSKRELPEHIAAAASGCNVGAKLQNSPKITYESVIIRSVVMLCRIAVWRPEASVDN